MAHVIARSAKGPRGTPAGGDDTYENLILLCPTHHRLVDKAPAGQYNAIDLRTSKADHEKSVRDRLQAPSFGTRREFAEAVLRLLQRNYAIWKSYGPESDVAQANPVSNVATLWTLRKLSVIIPNNQRISRAIEAHGSFLTPAEHAVAAEFMGMRRVLKQAPMSVETPYLASPRPFRRLSTLPQLNNWDISYSHITFVERALSGHQRVERFDRQRDIVFHIVRKDSLPDVVAALINRYTISLADLINAMAEFPEATCIVTAGDWNGYTQEAKEYGLNNGIGVFNISEFLVRCGVATWRSTLGRIKMAIQHTPIEVPDGVDVFVFGSALIDLASANDLDALFLYDEQKITASAIYAVIAPVRVILARRVGRPIHPVVLSLSEDWNEGFRRRFQSLPLADWLADFEGQCGPFL